MHYHLLTYRRSKEYKNKVMTSYRLVNIGPGTRSGLYNFIISSLASGPHSVISDVKYVACLKI